MEDQKSDLLPKLRNVEQFKKIPEKHLSWLIEKSIYQKAVAGQKLFEKGQPIDHMHIILSGILSMRAEQNGNFNEIGQVRDGGITGWLPYSRATVAMGIGVALTDMEVLSLDREYMKEMVLDHHELTEVLVHTMSSRVRDFTTASLQNEKMISLGKISAGLAHELNNPSSAIIRSSSALKSNLNHTPEKFKYFVSLQLDTDQLDKINELFYSVINNTSLQSISLIEKNDLEDDVAGYLEEKGFEDGYEFAEIFVEYRLDKDKLDNLYSICGKENFKTVVEWFDNMLTTEKLVSEIDLAAKRINNLVASVKSYSHMDRSPDKQPADLSEGILTTLVILNSKIKEKNVTIEKNFRKNLPKVSIFISEMNQVWTNILDNALDVLNEKGEIKISVYVEGDFIKIAFTDNGPGIPENIQRKIFDPFFTTKSIGQGTGLGLDIAQKIVQKHNGKIELKSKPGETTFTVCLPTDK